MDSTIKISLIIPIYRELKILERAICHFLTRGFDEIIIVDGGSNDSACQTIQCLSDSVRFLQAGKANRAFQMNLGASKAIGDVLCFAHIDMEFSENAVSAIKHAAQQRFLFGAFPKEYLDSTRLLAIYAALLNTVLLRWMKIIVGTNAMFVSAGIFNQFGGFPPAEFLEDIAFSRRLCQRYSPYFLKEKVGVSPRRYQQKGFWKQSLQNGSIFLFYYVFKIKPEKLKKLYH